MSAQPMIVEAAAAVSRGRVLCVDDEPHVLRALQWLLRKDFDVHTADSPAAAVPLLQRHDFDVVVSDQRMPGVTGVEFLHEVREITPRAMRILLTGYADLDAMVRSVNESEVYRFITKPWDVRELPRLIAEAVEISRAGVDAPAADRACAVDPEVAVPATPRLVVAKPATAQAEDVLLIDDNEDIHRAVTEALGGRVAVRHAYSLADALKMLKDKPVAVIVSELEIGRIDATPLVRLMKERLPEVVSIVFGGCDDAQVVMMLINQGQVYRFIPKPFKPGYIKIIVESALKRHREMVENPALLRRYAGEKPRPATSAAPLTNIDKLLVPVEPVHAAKPVVHAAASAPAVSRPVLQPAAATGVLGRVSSGFRRMFSV